MKTAMPSRNLVISKLSTTFYYIFREEVPSNGPMSISPDELKPFLQHASRYFKACEKTAQAKFYCEVRIVVQRETGGPKRSLIFKRAESGEFKYVIPEPQEAQKGRQPKPLPMPDRPFTPVNPMIAKSGLSRSNKEALRKSIGRTIREIDSVS